ncbi:MAG: AraC family transcriptional regulator [Terracidiphilus sp.]|jgi:AraC-like DNA-binding protein
MKASSYSRYFPVGDVDRAWGLHVTTVGHAVTPPGHPYPPGPHPAPYLFQWERGCVLDEFVLLYIKRGRGLLDSRHVRNVRLQPGDVILVCPNEWHRYRPDAETGWEEFWVHFNGDLAQNWRKRDFLKVEHPIIARNMSFALEGFFDALIENSKEQSAAPRLLAGLCHSILGCALSSVGHNEAVSREQQIRLVAEYIHSHSRKINLAGLAARFGMSYSTLQRLFKRHLGVTPSQYLAQERLSIAKKYLVETALPLKAIAGELEFSSEFYFMQVFKRLTGMTPTEWRSRHSHVF